MKELIMLNTSVGGVCMTIRAGYAKYSQQQVYNTGNFKNPFVMEIEYKIMAMRGRNLNSDKCTQNFEFNGTTNTNTLTSVTKDNLIYCMEITTKEGIEYPYVDVTIPQEKENNEEYIRETIYYIVEDSDVDLRPLIQDDGYIYICINEEMYRVRIRIRKLTERECFRLMDMEEEYIDKIQAYTYPNDDVFTDFQGNVLLSEEGKEQKSRKGKSISRTAQYKLAGNSIVTACLENIFEQLFYPDNKRTIVKQLSLF